MIRRHALSFTEVLVALALFGLLLTFVRVASQWRRSALDSMEKTELTARVRNTSLIVGRLLNQATAFLHPSDPGRGKVNQIVFRTRDNEIGAIYVDERGLLSYYNYSTGFSFPITPNTAGFQAWQERPNLLRFRVSLQRDAFAFFIDNQQTTANSLP